VEPWNACAHNMKLINHDLKDKWILDSGATNQMTGNPELLDGTTFLVLSISVYLGNNEKLMATSGLNVNLNSWAQLCTDLQCWIVLLKAASTTKEEKSYACSKLLETYSFWSQAHNESPDALSPFFQMLTLTSGIDQ